MADPLVQFALGSLLVLVSALLVFGVLTAIAAIVVGAYQFVANWKRRRL